MKETVIAGYVRTPFTFAKKGGLIGVRPDDLAAIAIKGLVDRTGVDPKLIEDVLMGCAYPEAEQGSNIARIASLLAGLPLQAGGMTINRFCGPRCRRSISPPGRSPSAPVRPSSAPAWNR